MKTTKFFSKPLFKQDIKSNWILILVILIVMVMMANVTNFAMSMMGKEEITEEMTEAQESLYAHMFVMAGYNQMAENPASGLTGATAINPAMQASGFKMPKLSLEDFEAGNNEAVYDMIFENASKNSDLEISAEALKDAIAVLEDSPVERETYVENFEYVYAMADAEGCFTGNELKLDEMMTNILEIAGISTTLVESMEKMDTTSLINQMYFHVIGLLPIFLLIAVLGNTLIVGQVERGSLAYTLSTPTKRSAVAITQALFMILVPLAMLAVVCVARTVSTKIFFGEVYPPKIIMLYVGMYLLVEAVCGLCYLGSCFANQSRKAMAFGGGLAAWFFLASLLGLFGSEDLVNMGIGVEVLDLFNKTTLITLFDINAIGTIGSGDINYDFVWKMAVLAAIAIVSYVTGAVKFCKKDLPL